MSENHIKSLEIFRSLFRLGILVVTLAGNSAQGESVADACAGALPVELNSSLRGLGGPLGEPFLVKLEVPSAGILSLDVALSTSAEAEPGLGFAGSNCHLAKTDSGPDVLERSPTHLVLMVRKAGIHIFRVASQDPRLPLREVKFRTRFFADASASPSPIKGGEDEEEIELEPDPLIYSGRSGGRSLPSRLHELCQQGEVDDHGDSFACATFLSLGQEVAGELSNGWGDDEDVFQFILGDSRQAGPWFLEVETVGGIDTFGVLYDQSGQRLARGESGAGQGSNFRIARTLDSGIYFLRVESRQGTEGVYSLSVEASPW